MDNIRLAMLSSGMSQVQLAEALGCSKASVSQWMSGKAVPPASRLKALAAALNVSEDYLSGAAPSETHIPDKRITVREAARCMRKSDDFVRSGLQSGVLPFGYAIKGSGARWSYFISPGKLRELVGAERFDKCFS